MTDSDLIQRLEAAEAGSRELDDEIATLLFTDKQRTCIKGLSDEAGGMWMFRYPNGSIGSSLRFTGSLDAAITLVPEGTEWALVQHEDNATARLYVGSLDWVRAATPILALCIAALRARVTS